jgi:hypothetical protein
VVVNNAQDAVSNLFSIGKISPKNEIQNSKLENQVILEFSNCK